MTEQSADKLNRLYSEMLVLLEKEKKIFDETERILAKAKAMIDPRKEFNKWLRSSEGEAWKQNLSIKMANVLTVVRISDLLMLLFIMCGLCKNLAEKLTSQRISNYYIPVVISRLERKLLILIETNKRLNYAEQTRFN